MKIKVEPQTPEESEFRRADHADSQRQHVECQTSEESKLYRAGHAESQHPHIKCETPEQAELRQVKPTVPNQVIT